MSVSDGAAYNLLSILRQAKPGTKQLLFVAHGYVGDAVVTYGGGLFTITPTRGTPVSSPSASETLGVLRQRVAHLLTAVLVADTDILATAGPLTIDDPRLILSIVGRHWAMRAESRVRRPPPTATEVRRARQQAAEASVEDSRAHGLGRVLRQPFRHPFLRHPANREALLS